MSWYWDRNDDAIFAGDWPPRDPAVTFSFGSRDDLGWHADERRAIAAAVILGNAATAGSRLAEVITVAPGDALTALQRLPVELRPNRVGLYDGNRAQDLGNLRLAIAALLGAGAVLGD